MNILENYIIKQSGFCPKLNSFPDSKPGIVVVIPSIGEPEITKTLDSLWLCEKPSTPVEVIVLINSSENSSDETKRQNELTEFDVLNWIENHGSNNLKVNLAIYQNIPSKVAGAGNARKLGMDEAIQRFISAGKDDGIICSLDADAKVQINYFTEVEKMFKWDKACNGCSIYFEHPLNGEDFPKNVYETITEYELHLRLYKQVLKFIGFPYFHHTVGSSFAVKASTYCKQGGMNRKQAGEDFYFLHKIMPLGHFYELNTTCVYPSSRPSNRVPFGTGATIREYATEEQKAYKTYNFQAFIGLKHLFEIKAQFFMPETNKVNEILLQLPKHLQDFLRINNFKAAVENMNANSSKIETFNKRFFDWFDAFRIIKYLNYVHDGIFTKQDVKTSVQEFLQYSGNQRLIDTSSLQLLELFRKKEKLVLFTDGDDN